MIDTPTRLYTRPVTADEAQAHYDARDCDGDHESVRYGEYGWQVVTCSDCGED